MCTERTFFATPSEAFSAFEDPGQLATWWGPDGFTNTFDEGGRWVFTMHGPNGANFANECIFRELVPDSRIVIATS